MKTTAATEWQWTFSVFHLVTLAIMGVFGVANYLVGDPYFLGVSVVLSSLALLSYLALRRRLFGVAVVLGVIGVGGLNQLAILIAILAGITEYPLPVMLLAMLLVHCGVAGYFSTSVWQVWVVTVVSASSLSVLLVHQYLEYTLYLVEAATYGSFATVAVLLAFAFYRLRTRLSAERKRSEELLQVKTRFLANMSHEIRTPLNGVVGIAESISLDATSAVLDDVDRLKASAAHLRAIVDDVLDYAKFESGAYPFRLEPVDLRALASQVTEITRADPRAASLDVSYTVSPELPSLLQTDGTRVRQVLLNLAMNAVKFTEEGTVRIEVAIEESPDSRRHVALTVRDTGVGIAADELPHLFEPFLQLDSSYSKRYSGTGLGLAITKRIAESLGGGVAVASRVGQGTTVTVAIPMASAKAPDLPLVTYHPNGQSPMKILLAEDDPVSAMVAQRLLSDHKVTHVSNGRRAVDAVVSGDFDLILMDIQMPEMDGLQAIEVLRANPRFRKVPIIALTAYAFEDDRQQFLAAGATDVVTKPVEKAKIEAVISSLAVRAAG